MNIAIVDDVKEQGEQLHRLCDDYFREKALNVTYDIWTSGRQLFEYCLERENAEIDLLFLDIEMPDMDGIRIKDLLAEESMIRRIIFVTSHREVMQDAFGSKVIAFLEKPVKSEEVHRWLRYVQEQLNKNTMILFDGEEETIYLEQVEYLEGEKNYTKIHLRDGQEKWLWKNMKYMESILEGMSVIRVHKSYMVNLMYVSDISDNVYFKDSESVVPVGRKYISDMKGAYREFQRERIRELMK